MSSMGEVFFEECDINKINWLKSILEDCGGGDESAEPVKFENFTYYSSKCSEHAQVWHVEVSGNGECWILEVVQYNNDTYDITEV
jgi:hypothetical protein